MIALAHIIIVVVVVVMLIAAVVILHDIGWKNILEWIESLICLIVVLAVVVSIWWAIDTVLIYYEVML